MIGFVIIIFAIWNIFVIIAISLHYSAGYTRDELIDMWGGDLYGFMVLTTPFILYEIYFSINRSREIANIDKELLELKTKKEDLKINMYLDNELGK
jgi:hypothetical protein